MKKSLSNKLTQPFETLFRLLEGSDIRRDGCWVWLGRERLNLPRWSYENLVGPVPAGKQIFQTCLNPKCWNPGHLLLTQTAPLALSTHCKRGHPFSGTNLYVRQVRGNKGIRVCRACAQQARIRYFKRKLQEQKSG